MERIYTGIGSRETPNDILKLMTLIAEFLYKRSYTLRSGGAEGADLAFEEGAKEKKEIYIPWKGFNKSTSSLCEIPEEAFLKAEKVHPAWHNCSIGAKRLHARNIMQILGKDLCTPAKFVVCWTKDGKKVGGTATAINLAEENRIRIFNLANPQDKYQIVEKIKNTFS